MKKINYKMSVSDNDKMFLSFSCLSIKSDHLIRNRTKPLSDCFDEADMRLYRLIV